MSWPPFAESVRSGATHYEGTHCPNALRGHTRMYLIPENEEKREA
jgi:hypothetical protein